MTLEGKESPAEPVARSDRSLISEPRQRVEFVLVLLNWPI
jgi:hypothetical protein